MIKFARKVLHSLISKIYDLLTKNKLIVIFLIIAGVIFGPPWQSLWYIISPPTPKISTHLITIPSYAPKYTEHFSIINSRYFTYDNLIIKFTSTDNFKISDSSLQIEPEEHTILAELEGIGILDANFVTFCDFRKSVMYLKINNLKSQETLSYILRISNNDTLQHKIKISVTDHKILKKVDFAPFLINIIKKFIIENKCNKEISAKGLIGRSRRVNQCLGGLKGKLSNELKDVYSLNLWLFPEWKEDETNFIFDTGPETAKNRVSVYRTKGYLITEIYESDGNKHTLKGKADFINGWNDIYFVLNKSAKNIELYLNTNQVINYTFNRLLFEYPEQCYFGINSNEDTNLKYYGNFLLDNMGVWSRTLSRQEIIRLYNNGNGLFFEQMKSNN